MIEFLKVSAKSRSTAVAGAIAGTLRTNGRVEVQAIGAAAVNQAIKAVAIARRYVRESGFDLAVVPTFLTVQIEGSERTAMRFYVESRDLEFAPNVPLGEWRVDYKSEDHSGAGSRSGKYTEELEPAPF